MNRNLLLTVLITGTIATQSFAAASVDPFVVGAVYAMTNDAQHNAVVVFDRYDDGTLTLRGDYSREVGAVSPEIRRTPWAPRGHWS